MIQSGFLWICWQNWSTLSILKILHFYNRVQKSGLFWFLEKFWSEKSDWVFGLPSPRGGIGVGDWIFRE